MVDLPRCRHLVAAVVLCLTVLIGSGAHAQSAPPLVDPAWLVGQLQDPHLVLLDLRRKAASDTGHLSGAINIDPATVSFRQPASNGGSRLPSAVEFAARLGGLGIRAEDKIVLISAGDSWLDVAGATDVFWLLKRFGHVQVAILDGGFRRLAEAAGSLVWFALRVILGNRDVRLYDGGFREWAADPARSVVVHVGSGETQRP